MEIVKLKGNIRKFRFFVLWSLCVLNEYVVSYLGFYVQYNVNLLYVIFHAHFITMAVLVGYKRKLLSVCTGFIRVWIYDTTHYKLVSRMRRTNRILMICPRRTVGLINWYLKRWYGLATHYIFRSKKLWICFLLDILNIYLCISTIRMLLEYTIQF